MRLGRCFGFASACLASPMMGASNRIRLHGCLHGRCCPGSSNRRGGSLRVLRSEVPMRPYFKRPADDSELAVAKLLQPLEAGAPVEPSNISGPATPMGAVAVDEVIDVAAAGKMLRIGRNKLYEMVARNQIPHRRFGRCIRFS